MAISMIELQGGIQRTQDFTSIKHQENAKNMVDQSNLQQQNDKRIVNQHNQVNKGSESTKADTHADASEQGKNQYAGDGGAKRKKQEVPLEGRVVRKGTGHFDISI